MTSAQPRLRCPTPVALSRAVAEGLDDELRAHVTDCLRCSELVESFEVPELTELPVAEPSSSHARMVRAQLLAAAGGAGARPRRAWFAWAFAGAGFATAAVVLVLYLRRAEPAAEYRGTIHPHAQAAWVRLGTTPDEIVRLTDGMISIEVDKLLPGERFRVVTGDAEVEVRGTAFEVVAFRDHLHKVRVHHGRVEVRAAGAPIKMLEAGERWETTLAAADPTTDAARNDRGAGSGNDPSTSPRPLAAPTESREPSDKPVASSEPAVATLDPRKPAVATVPAAESKPAVATAPAAPRKPAVVAEPRKPAVATAPPAPVVADPRKLTVQTQTAPSTVAPKRAIEVAFDRGWERLRAGDPRNAAAEFERAALAAPRDPLAEDAWFWHAASLVRAKSTGAVAALDRFLATYPGSPRHGEASAMLGWLVIDNLDRAEALFRSAASDRAAQVRASAEKGLAAIAKRRKP
jgi:TolA-binding protein